MTSGHTLTEEGRRRWEMYRLDEDSFSRAALRLVGNAEDAADLVQDVGLRILRHPTGPEDDGCFRAWCYGLLRNTATDYRRSAARRHQAYHVELDSADCALHGVFVDPEYGVEARRFLGMVDTLDDSERELVFRRYLLEETSTEIARQLESSPPAVRMKLRRICSKLRGIFMAMTFCVDPCAVLDGEATAHPLPTARSKAPGGAGDQPPRLRWTRLRSIRLGPADQPLGPGSWAGAGVAAP